MNTKYTDLINQTYYFPQEEFKLEKTTYNFIISFNEISGKVWYSLKFIYPRFQTTSTKLKVGLENRWKKNKYAKQIFLLLLSL
jgi:arginine decarboxylase